MASLSAGEEAGGQQAHRYGSERTDPHGRENVKGGGAAVSGPDGGHCGGQQLDGSGVQHHQQTELVAGGAAAAAGHPAGGLNSKGGSGVAKPQEIGGDVGGDSGQRLAVLTCLRQQTMQ